MSELTMYQNKIQLRKTFRELRATAFAALKKDYPERISDILMSSEIIQRDVLVLCYVSIKTEADTTHLMTTLISRGYRLACPISIMDPKGLEFHEISSLDELAPGAFHIPEPSQSSPIRSFADFQNSVCLVPGLAFDMSGARLGYGGGFYDRFLQSYPGTSIGLTYGACIAKEPLPREDTDQTVDYLCFEQGLFPCTKTW